MENNNCKFIVGNSQLSQTVSSARPPAEGGISFRRWFLNHTNRTLYILDRNGVKFRVDKVANDYRQHFIIRTAYTVPGHVYDDFQPVLNNAMDHPDNYPDLVAIRDAFFNRNSDNRFQQRTVYVDTIVSQTEFDKEHSVYVTNMDLVLTTCSPDKEVVHPFGKVSMFDAWYQKRSKDCSGVSIFVEIVDNDNQIGNRFVYTAKRVFEVPAIQDNTRESGIYLCCIEKRPGFEDSISSVRFELTEGEEKLGLYKTQEEAISDGDIKAKRDKELADLKFEMQRESHLNAQQSEEQSMRLTTLKNKNLEIEADNKRKDLIIEEMRRERDQDRALHELKLTTIRAEYEAAKIKDSHQYDKESTRIKLKNEIIKLTATAITSGLAVTVLLLKYGNKEK